MLLVPRINQKIGSWQVGTRHFSSFWQIFCHIWRFFNVPQQPQTVHYIRCALFWNIIKYSKDLGKMKWKYCSIHLQPISLWWRSDTWNPDFWVPVLPLKCKAVFFFFFAKYQKKKLSQYYYLCEDCRKFLFCTLIVINAIVVLQLYHEKMPPKKDFDM